MMDDVLMTDDGIDFIIATLDRCFEVTQDQYQAPKIERALYLL